MWHNLPLLFLFYGDWAVFALRLVLGVILVVHCWPKLRDIRTTNLDFEIKGFRPGWLWGPLVTAVEFVGGLALIFGAYVQFAAALIVIQFMVIVVWRLRRRERFVGAFEYDILILAAAFVLLTQGAGAFSAIDILERLIR